MKKFKVMLEGKDPENGVITGIAFKGVEAKDAMEAKAFVERYVNSEFVSIEKIERFTNVPSFICDGILISEEVDTE